MKHIKLFKESNLEYNNTYIDISLLEEIVENKSIPFTSNRLKELINYFSKWECKSIFYANQEKINDIASCYYNKSKHTFSDKVIPKFVVNCLDDSRIDHYLTIMVDNDDYYYLYDWTDNGYKCVKCDDIGGLMIYCDELFKKSFKVDSEISKKKHMINLIKDSFNELNLESIDMDKLSELKKYIENL